MAILGNDEWQEIAKLESVTNLKIRYDCSGQCPQKASARYVHSPWAAGTRAIRTPTRGNWLRCSACRASALYRRMTGLASSSTASPF